MVHHFLKPLSAGGLLAAGNCAAWIILFLIGPLGIIDWRLIAAFEILLSLPFFILLPFGHMVTWTVSEVVAQWICIALNSFAWGYSIAWLLRQIPRRSNRDPMGPITPK